MKGIVFDGEELRVVEGLELRDPGPGEVIVRIANSGVCHSDVSVIDGTIPFPTPVVLGHEGAGVVEAVGPGILDLEKGDHVVMSFGSCGRCPSCLDAEPALCYTTDHFACTREDGSFYLEGAEGPVHGDFFNQSSFATYAIANFSRPDRNRPFAISIFIALYFSGAAAASAVDGASTARSELKVFPLRKSSTACSLNGRPAIPPNTTRESVIVSPLISSPIAIDAIAKSHTPRGRIFSNDARNPFRGAGSVTSVKISLNRTTCDWILPSTIMSPGTNCSTLSCLVPSGPTSFTVASNGISAGAASPGYTA